MGTYKISGTAEENCTIHILQNEDYKAKKEVSKGSYEIFFESVHGDNIIAVAENESGIIVGFGRVQAIEILQFDDDMIELP